MYIVGMKILFAEILAHTYQIHIQFSLCWEIWELGYFSITLWIEPVVTKVPISLNEEEEKNFLARVWSTGVITVLQFANN